ncbi:hypothetical protein FQR65_LT03091 [Abscondita terminalis]|nr:hypothetical protein FQR65_LT03091 [Abscondita terminalis]
MQKFKRNVFGGESQEPIPRSSKDIFHQETEFLTEVQTNTEVEALVGDKILKMNMPHTHYPRFLSDDQPNELNMPKDKMKHFEKPDEDTIPFFKFQLNQPMHNVPFNPPIAS